jgi:hypothetical protein
MQPFRLQAPSDRIGLFNPSTFNCITMLRIIMKLALICVASMLSLLFCPEVKGQDVARVTLSVTTQGGTTETYDAVPASAAIKLFPDFSAVFERRSVSFQPGDVAGSITQQVNFGVLRAPASHRVTDATMPGTSSRQPPEINAAIYGNKVFILGVLTYGENINVVNELLRALGTTINSPAQALQLSEFYIRLAYYRFSDLTAFLASAQSELSVDLRESKGPNVRKILTLPHPPLAIADGVGFKVDFVTVDRDSAFLVHRWLIQVSNSQISDVQDEWLGPFASPFSDSGCPRMCSGSSPGTSSKTLVFAMNQMFDGFTEDLSTMWSGLSFSVSDGPDVRRIVSSYPNAADAEKKMRDEMGKSDQVLRQGVWADEQGKKIGDWSIVLDRQKESEKLEVRILLRRDTRLFEVYSDSLRNALEFEKSWFHAVTPLSQQSPAW